MKDTYKDDYFIEYTVKNTSSTQLSFHKIEFRTLDFYFSKKIVRNQLYMF